MPCIWLFEFMGLEVALLELKSPPPRSGNRILASGVGVSLILHGVLFACMLGFGALLVRQGTVLPGGAVAVSLVDMGSTAVGQTGLSKQSASAAAIGGDSPAGQNAEEHAAPSVRSEPEAAVAVKKTEVKPEPAEKAEKHAARKSVATPRPQHQQQEGRQAPMQQDLPARQADAATAAGGDNGKSAASSGAGAAEQATSSAQGQGNPQPQVMPWNAAGGPAFMRQGPLHYPRAAQRRNLEGKAVVEAYLDMQGKLVRARVLQADHQDFADAALACIQASSFKPAQREGRAIPCVVRIPMLFVLKGM